MLCFHPIFKVWPKQFIDLAAFGHDLLNDAVLCHQGGSRLIGPLPLAKYPPIMVQYFCHVLA